VSVSAADVFVARETSRGTPTIAREIPTVAAMSASGGRLRTAGNRPELLP
jgi:hypothetical protein